MKKIKKVIINICTIVLIMLFISPIETLADVGSFDSYDSGWGDSWSSGSDWGDSWGSDWGDSWDSDSDWSSDWDDDDWSSRSSGRKRYVLGSKSERILGYIMYTILTATGIGAVIRLFIRRKVRKTIKHIETIDDRKRVREANKVYDEMVVDPEIYQGPVVERIKAVDEFFDKDQFNENTKKLFIKMQEAWTKRDWETIREFETEELYEQHKLQIDGYIRSGTINVLENIEVPYSKIYTFNQKGDTEIITAVVKVYMSDYIIDEANGKVLKGDKNRIKEKFYKLEFIRRLGLKTKPENLGINMNNCPNCGAPIKINSIGECEYCKTTIINGDYGWVLNNYEPFQINNN